ncbi:hypothetical protein [Roseateles koreensis]|uniref:Uncharacterized protein n=1 Tax=Roseateles koreensis TaxID=2987526 RepID=A0ABT5KV62_9BURK|nr:hypothetical protein [Roseateles koreensis]MDC8786320.1 hypothetical protein [Roseateles koreensis]
MTKHSAETAKEDTERKAKAKIRVLTAWATQKGGIPWRKLGDGYLLDRKGRRILEYFPTTPAEFAKWISEDNFTCSVKESIKHFERISKGTLAQTYHKDLLKDVTTAIAKVQDIATPQLNAENHADIISAQKLTIKLLTNLTQIQERDINSLTDKTESLGSLVSTLTRTIQNNDEVTLYHVTKLEERVAALTKALYDANSLRLIKESENVPSQRQ